MTYEQETLWLAGLLEGEGYFGKQSNSNSVVVQLLMTDEDVVRHAAIVMKANVHLARDARVNRKAAYRAFCCGENAINLMARLLPFMGTRRKEKITQLLEISKKRISRAEALQRGRVASSLRAAAITHCPRGHEYSPENSKRYKKGRACLICARYLSKKRYYARKMTAPQDQTKETK